jgi:hypothetical protein
MSFLIVDTGSSVPTGYLSPEVPIFALSDGGTAGVASVIANAGGSVVVDTLGGISMTTQATSFIGLDSFNNIAINTSNATPNATIEMIGQSTVTIQSTDGLAVVESVINDSFLSLGLDVELQARGALLGGGNVNITNAGTFAFDTLGSGAITGLSTINGVAYSAPVTIPTNLTLSTLTVNGTGNISLQTNPNFASKSALMLFKSAGQDTVNSGILGVAKSIAANINNATVNGLGVYAFSTISGAYQPLLAESYYVVGSSNDGSGYGAAQISYTPTTSSITLTAPNVSFTSLTDISTITGGATLDISATAVTVSGVDVSLVDTGGDGFSVIGGTVKVNGDVSISTISGISSINGTSYNDQIVSTLTVADFVSTLALGGISSIVGGTNLDMTAGTLNIVGATNLYLIDGGGGGLEVTSAQPRITGNSGLVIDNNLSVSTITNISSINGVEYPPAPVVNPTRQATYYKSVAQTLINGDTDITFDLSGAWNNADGYITHTDGTTDFTVATTGLYQLEFNATVLANAATWTTASNKQIVIDITRLTSQAVIGQSAVMSSANSYLQAVNGTYYLEVGDVINLRITNTFTGGPPTASGITNTFDLNTFFSWRYIP